MTNLRTFPLRVFILPSHLPHLCQSLTSSLLTDWSDTETDGKSGKSKNLWEESWDDDETTDDFAAQLRYILLPLSSTLHATGTVIAKMMNFRD